MIDLVYYVPFPAIMAWSYEDLVTMPDVEDKLNGRFGYHYKHNQYVTHTVDGQPVQFMYRWWINNLTHTVYVERTPLGTSQPWRTVLIDHDGDLTFVNQDLVQS